MAFDELCEVASTLWINVILGGVTSIVCNFSSSFSAADSINAQCEGTLTGKSNALLAPDCFAASIALSTAAACPAITI